MADMLLGKSRDSWRHADFENETVLLSTQNTCFNLLISYPFIYLESSKSHKYLISYAFYDVIVSILTPLCFYTYKFFSVY